MPAVTVPRADLSTEEMVTVLRDGPGGDYNVLLPGMTMGQLPLQGPREGPAGHDRGRHRRQPESQGAG
jgi:hypothetical protein